MKPKKIFVLSDPFVEIGSLSCSLVLAPFEDSGIDVERITSDFVKSGKLMDHTDAILILPGSGDGDGYRATMNGTGFANELAFLEAGGRSLRICASAYMAYSSYGYHQKRYDSLAYLFEGHAHGPICELYNPDRPWRDLMDTHDIAMLEHHHADGSIIPAASAYSAGPRLPETDGVRVIARFMDAKDRTPAVMATRIGDGLAVISSVALEINGAYTIKNMRPVNPKSEAMHNYAEALAQFEPERSRLWEDVWHNYLLADDPAI